MAGWLCPDAETIEWDGTIKAKRMKDNGTAPVQNNDIVNKAYVDNSINALSSGASRIHISKDAAQTLTDAVDTKIQYNDEQYDNLGEYDNATNYRFTAQQAGYYLVSASINTANVAWTIDDSGRLGVYKNGVIDLYLERVEMQATITAFMQLQGTDITYLDAGDYLEVYALITRGADTDTGANAGYNYFKVHRLS